MCLDTFQLMRGFLLMFEDNALVQAQVCSLSEEELTLDGWPQDYKCRIVELSKSVNSEQLGFEGDDVEVNLLVAAPAYPETNWNMWLITSQEAPLRINVYPLRPGVIPHPTGTISQSSRLTGVRATLVRA